MTAPSGPLHDQRDPRLIGTREVLEYALIRDEMHLGFIRDFVIDSSTGSVEHIIVYFLPDMREDIVNFTAVAHIDHSHSILRLRNSNQGDTRE